jgi:serine beta-lactamase-like protein LACTB, mitochondrial
LVSARRRLRQITLKASLSAAVSIGISASALAQPYCNADTLQNALNQAVNEMVRDPSVVGTSSAIAIGGSANRKATMLTAVAGQADREQDVRMTPDHVIAIGSISKLLTAATLARMVDAGITTFDADVRPLVPRLSRAAPRITLAQLAGHMAGLRHYVSSDRIFGPQPSANESHSIDYKTVDQALEIFIDDDLLATPGTQQNYSSYGYTLLSAALERAGGQDFPALVKSHVTDPLGMTQTQPDDVHKIIPMRAPGYAAEAGQVSNAPAHNPSYVWAGGGFSSTPKDLARFAISHGDAAFLKPATRTIVFAPQRLNDGRLANNGIGWEVRFDEFNRSYVENEDAALFQAEFRALMKTMPPTAFHAGSVTGGHGLLVYIPSSKVAITYLSNTNGPDVDRAATKMAFRLMQLAKQGDDLAQKCGGNFDRQKLGRGK